jgi:hypothetical protein
MAKAKKKKKVQKQRQQSEKLRKLQSMTANELVAKAEAEFKVSQIRDSILSFRQALKKGGDETQIGPRLFLVYRARYEQLTARQMDKEAVAISKLGGQIFKSLPRLSRELLNNAFEFLPARDIMDVYAGQADKLPLSPEAEKHLACRLVAEGYLDQAKRLPDGSRLKSDQPIMAEAHVHMVSGDWNAALAAMRGLGRTSPFADMKLFAKAMVAWEADDRKTLGKTLHRLDGRLPFKGLGVLLEEYADHGHFKSLDVYPKTAAMLMGPAIHKDAFRDRIKNSLQPRSVNIDSLAAACRTLGEILRPDAPQKAVEGLAEIIGTGLIQADAGTPLLNAFLEKLIKSAPRRNLLLFKITAVDRDFISPATARYLDEAKTEFPDRKELDTAWAFILLRIAQTVQLHPFILYEYEDELIDTIEAFGISEDLLDKDLDLIVLTLITAAADKDPGNRAVYDAVFPIATPLAEHRSLMTRILEQMVERFPEAVTACLKLSELYYRKSAFRKAEAVLQKAYDRAPHDIKVKESCALSLVISAQQNLPRQKWHLVDRDLDRALEFNAPGLVVVITEKRLLVECLKTQKFSAKEFAARTEAFTPAQRMQCFLLLRMDLDAGYGKASTRGTGSCFNGLKKQITDLPPSDLAELVAPLDSRFAPAFPSCFYARPLLGKKGRILSRLSPDETMSLAIPLARHHCMEIAVHTLEQKLKGASIDTYAKLMFYQTALCAVRDGRHACPELSSIVSTASPQVTEQLRHISRAIADLAFLPLKEQFERFEFDRYSRYGDEYMDIEDDPEIDGDAFLADFMDILMDKVEPEQAESFQKDFYPADLNVKQIFGKKANPDRFKETISSLTAWADRAINGSNSPRYGRLDDFFAEFEDLLNMIRSAGIRTTSQNRNAGRQFAEAYDHCHLILSALDSARSAPQILKAPDTQHFILGMRTGA